MWKQEINQKKKREWKNLEEFVAELSCPWLTNWASVCFMLEKQFNKNDSDCYSAPDMEILCFQILWLRFRFTASRPSVNRQEIQPKHPGVSWTHLTHTHTHTHTQQLQGFIDPSIRRDRKKIICNHSDHCFSQIPASEMREFTVFFLRSCWVLDGWLEEIQLLVLILWNLFQPNIIKVPVSGCNLVFSFHVRDSQSQALLDLVLTSMLRSHWLMRITVSAFGIVSRQREAKVWH